MSRVADAVREQVERRAGGGCEYCLKPDIAATYGYHVDHIIPIFHGGTSNLDNLAWACFECNVNKGRDVASYDTVTHDLTRLYNPRRDDWDANFMFQGATIVGKTPIGRVTVTVLIFNQLNQLEARLHLMEMGLW